jgi:hypothetical protein
VKYPVEAGGRESTMAKRARREFDAEEPEDELQNPDDEALEEEVDDADDSADEEESQSDAEAKEEEQEEEELLEPDHPDTVAALKEIGARCEVDKTGHVWRVFFYEKNTDEHLSQLHGLAGLKEIWLIGSRVTPKGVEELKEEYPKVTVYY